MQQLASRDAFPPPSAVSASPDTSIPVVPLKHPVRQTFGLVLLIVAVAVTDRKSVGRERVL